MRCYGSPNTIYATEICNWHKDYAARFTYGTISARRTSPMRTVFCYGATIPRLLWLPRHGEVQKASKRGAKLMVVDPRPTALAKRATQWRRCNPGTDQARARARPPADIDRALRSSVRAHMDQRQLPWCEAIPAGSCAKAPCARMDRPAISSRAFATVSRSTMQRAGAGRMARWSRRCASTVDTLAGPIACRTAFDTIAQLAADYPPQRRGAERRRAGRSRRCSGRARGCVVDCLLRLERRRPAWTATQTDRAISILYAWTGSYGRKGGNVPGSAAPFADISGQDLLAAQQKSKALGLDKRPCWGLPNGWVTGARDAYRAVLTQEPYPVRMLVSFGTNCKPVSQPDAETARKQRWRPRVSCPRGFLRQCDGALCRHRAAGRDLWEREGLRSGFDVVLEELRRVQPRQAAMPIWRGEVDTDIVMEADRVGIALSVRWRWDKGQGAWQAGLSVAELARSGRRRGLLVEAHALKDGSPRGYLPRKIELYSERLLRRVLPAHSGVGTGHGSAVDADTVALGSFKTVLLPQPASQYSGAAPQWCPIRYGDRAGERLCVLLRRAFL